MTHLPHQRYSLITPAVRMVLVTSRSWNYLLGLLSFLYRRFDYRLSLSLLFLVLSFDSLLTTEGASFFFDPMICCFWCWLLLCHSQVVFSDGRRDAIDNESSTLSITFQFCRLFYYLVDYRGLSFLLIRLVLPFGLMSVLWRLVVLSL